MDTLLGCVTVGMSICLSTTACGLSGRVLRSSCVVPLLQMSLFIFIILDYHCIIFVYSCLKHKQITSIRKCDLQATAVILSLFIVK